MSHSCFRIFDENYVDIDILANQDYSSQQSAFPATNVYNTLRRSKVWRTNGRYEVTSSNNTIIFREGAGIDLTATITAGNYTSTTTFMAAVKSALDAAGVSTYTVEQTNLRFKITSNGVGGDGRFELMLTDASFTAEDILGFDNASNKTGALNYTADYVVIHYPHEYLIWDMGISTNPSAFILVGLRNDSLPYSPNATIKIEGNETNSFNPASWSTTLTYDDEVLSHITDTGMADQAYRYWRLKFEDETNGNGYIQVSSVFLGNYFDPARGRAQFPLSCNYIDRSTSAFSEGGQAFFDLKEQTARFDVDFFALQKADAEYFDSLFETYGITKPLFVSMDTTETFSSSKNRRIIYAYFSGPPQWQLVRPDIFTLRLSFTEAL